MKTYLPTITFSALTLLTGIFYYQIIISPFNTSHFTLFAPSPWSMFYMTTLLLLVSIGYYSLSKKKVETKLFFFLLHLGLTVPLLYLIQSVMFFTGDIDTHTQITDGEILDDQAIESLRKWTIATYLFFSSQLVFMASFIWKLIVSRR